LRKRPFSQSSCLHYTNRITSSLFFTYLIPGSMSKVGAGARGHQAGVKQEFPLGHA
jgi:hypothetical protein